jgi:hypothetical protein
MMMALHCLQIAASKVAVQSTEVSPMVMLMSETVCVSGKGHCGPQGLGWVYVLVLLFPSDENFTFADLAQIKVSVNVETTKFPFLSLLLIGNKESHYMRTCTCTHSSVLASRQAV